MRTSTSSFDASDYDKRRLRLARDDLSGRRDLELAGVEADPHV